MKNFKVKKCLVIIFLPMLILFKTYAINHTHKCPDGYESYKIVKGDSLWLIAKKFYQNPYDWRTLWNNNSYVIKPRLIYPNNIICIPCCESTSPEVEVPQIKGTIYQPRLDLEGKIGTRRGISRVGFILPLLQNPNTLLFTHLIGFADSSTSIEGNFGLGLRRKFENHIVGVYGFYDRRKTNYQNHIQQFTFGGEYLARKYEFRANGYLPERAPRVISKPPSVSGKGNNTANNTLYALHNGISYEVPLTGFDIEAGFHLPKLRDTRVFGAFYHLFGKKISTKINGGRLRFQHQILPWLSIDGEYSYDNYRKSRIFGGLQLTWTPNMLKEKNVDILINKMTQPIVRDIDISLAKTQASLIQHEEDGDVESYIETLVKAPQEEFNKIAKEILEKGKKSEKRTIMELSRMRENKDSSVSKVVGEGVNIRIKGIKMSAEKFEKKVRQSHELLKDMAGKVKDDESLQPAASKEVAHPYSLPPTGKSGDTGETVKKRTGEHVKKQIKKGGYEPVKTMSKQEREEARVELKKGQVAYETKISEEDQRAGKEKTREIQETVRKSQEELRAKEQAEIEK